MMIECKDVCAGYDQHNVLKGITLEIGDHDLAVIIGPNGAGKSTLLHALIGFLPLRSGSIKIKGQALPDWNRRELARVVALIPQESALPFDYTVREMVLMGRYPWLELLQKYSDRDAEIAREAMAKLDLLDLANRFYSQLSGGEKQRVLLARALAQQTEIILLDEALSQLDINHQVELMQLLYDINLTGTCIVLISHNINLAANLSSHLILIKDGQVIANGSPETVLTKAKLLELFGIELSLEQNSYSGRPNLVYPAIHIDH